MDLKPTDFAWIIAIVTAISTLIGVVISSIFSYLNQRLVRKSEELRQLRELVISAAIESWKFNLESYKIHQQPMKILPLDAYIIHMLKFSEVILKEDVDESNIEEKMKEVKALSRKVTQIITDFG
jgi:hypothetical protein